jgi:hypothetical protein
MTRDELHALWIAGESYSAIGSRFGLTRNVVAGKVRHYRRHEGEDLWPHRETPIRTQRAEPPQKPLRGRSTLPPLSSLVER